MRPRRKTKPALGAGQKYNRWRTLSEVGQALVAKDKPGAALLLAVIFALAPILAGTVTLLIVVANH
jgi:hypothetical protein